MNGPNFQTLAGASIFSGTGNAYHTGVPSSFYQTTGYYAGVGAYAYSGPGYAQYLAMPLAVFAATWSFYGVGVAWAHMGTPPFHHRSMDRARDRVLGIEA